MNVFNYGVEVLTVDKAMAIAKGKLQGVLPKQSIESIEASAAAVQKIVRSGKTVYGINTGFGPLCDTIINEVDTKKLQENLLISHAVGVGNPIPTIIAKLMLICKVQALSYGYSGVTLAVVERIIWHIDNDIIPIVPEKGSVGASGDLAPLAHLFLPLIGLGKLMVNGTVVHTNSYVKKQNIAPLVLQAKEGLGLINGTQFIVAHTVYGLYKMQRLLNAADVIGAMSLEAYMGSVAPFSEALHTLRPYQGTQLVAKRLAKIIEGSAIVQSHYDCTRVQDPYSIRCMPQVHGASRNAITHLEELTTIELNSVTDNPIVLNETEAISGGNFHGQPLAMAIDYATIATAELGNISDRRCYLLLEGKYGLPKLLTAETGINSGLMIPQYTTAALVTENKTLCFPASADSIPTSLGQEDHVSMGSISSRKFLQVVDNLKHILAIELLYATQGIHLRRPLKSSAYIETVLAKINTFFTPITNDREFYYDIENFGQFIEAAVDSNLFDDIT